MPRKPRVAYPGAMYHLMSRGDQRDDISLDDVDRQDFLKTLAEACQKTGWEAQAKSHLHQWMRGSALQEAAQQTFEIERIQTDFSTV